MSCAADISLQFENIFLNYSNVCRWKLQIFLKLTMESVLYWHAVKNSLIHINVKKFTLKILSILDYCAFMRIYVAIVIKCKGIDQKHTKKCIQAFKIIRVLKLIHMHTFAFMYDCVLLQYVQGTGILHALTYAHQYQNMLCDLHNKWQLKKVKYCDLFLVYHILSGNNVLSYWV